MVPLGLIVYIASSMENYWAYKRSSKNYLVVGTITITSTLACKYFSKKPALLSHIMLY
jgi:hypothetical protein